MTLWTDICKQAESEGFRFELNTEGTGGAFVSELGSRYIVGSATEASAFLSGVVAGKVYAIQHRTETMSQILQPIKL